MKKQKSSKTSSIGLIIGWPFFTSALLFLFLLPIYGLLIALNSYSIIVHGLTGFLVLVGHVASFFLSYRIISASIKGAVSMAAFYTAMILTIAVQVSWRLQMFLWTRLDCNDECVATVLDYQIDGIAVFATLFALVLSGFYLNQKILSEYKN